MTDLLAEFRLRDWIQPGGYYGALVYGVLFFGMAYVLGRAVRIGVQRLLEKDKRRLVDHTTVSFLAQLARIGIYIFSFVSYAHLIPALQRLGTAWLASVGVASVVFGMAAQNTLGNLIAGFSLLLYQPFKLGDRLQIMAPTGLETGTVESLNLGYTVLKTPDNRRVVVPNSVIASQTTVNLSMVEERMIFTLTVGISYRADLDKARSILLQLAKDHPKAQQVTGCSVSELGSSSVHLSLSMWCADSGTAAVLKADLLESVKKRFDAEGIEIPYPYSNVILITASRPGSATGPGEA
jgi:small conductance mechanosensitive channel